MQNIIEDVLSQPQAMEQKLNVEREFHQWLQHQYEPLQQEFQDGLCRCYSVKVEKLINKHFAEHSGARGSGAVSGDSGEECYGSEKKYPSGVAIDPPHDTTSSKSFLMDLCLTSWLYDNAKRGSSHSRSRTNSPAPCGRNLEQGKVVQIKKYLLTVMMGIYMVTLSVLNLPWKGLLIDGK